MLLETVKMLTQLFSFSLMLCCYVAYNDSCTVPSLNQSWGHLARPAFGETLSSNLSRLRATTGNNLSIHRHSASKSVTLTQSSQVCGSENQKTIRIMVHLNLITGAQVSNRQLQLLLLVLL